ACALRLPPPFNGEALKGRRTHNEDTTKVHPNYIQSATKVHPTSVSVHDHHGLLITMSDNDHRAEARKGGAIALQRDASVPARRPAQRAMRSLPTHCRSTSGTVTQPSACWVFSRMATMARVTATAVPLSVCAKRALPAFGLQRMLSRSAWKS